MAVDILNRKRIKRVKPCQRCKIQRRKCDRPPGHEACLRCQEANRECVYDDGPVEIEDDAIDGNFDLEQLAMEVSSLKESLNHMERSLQQGRTSTTMTTPTTTQSHSKPDPTVWIPWSDHDATPMTTTTTTATTTTTTTCYDHDSTYSFYVNTDPHTSSLQLSPVSTYTSTMSTCSSDSRKMNETEENDDYQWDLTLINGTLQLNSPIRSIKELLAYGNALQRYLSPFAGVFDKTSFVFESTQPQSLVPTVIQVAAWASPPSSGGSASAGAVVRKNNNNTSSMLDKYRFVLKRHHPAVLAAANHQPPPISCIDELISHYLTCFNRAFPMVHGPSYRAEYESVIRCSALGATRHALTMAICASVCCSTCVHISFDNYERRILADYFYERAIDLLSDSFDDPDRRLETVMIINILSQYQQMTLRLPEGRKWCTIAYMIAKELQREYNSHPEWQPPTATGNEDAASTTTTSTRSSSSSSSSSKSSTHGYSTPPLSPSSTGPESLVMTDLAPTTTDKDLLLFSRHFLMALFNQKFCDLILDHNPIIKEVLGAHPILYMEDECELTRSFTGIFNKGLQLYSHPVVLELREQMQRMHLGEKAKVTLELILRYDQIYQDWWQSLPPEFRLCDENPLDLSCRPLVETCREPMKLVMYIIAVSQKAEANLTMAKPSNQAAISQGGTFELVRAIQERALKEALDCTEGMAVAIRNLEANKLHCIFSSDMLIALSDLLCTLAASSNISVKNQAKQRLVEALTDLRHAKFMEGNLVPEDLSPLRFLDAPEMKSRSSSSSASNKLSHDIMEMYNDYSIPCFAFGYDILRKASMNSYVQ